MARADAAVGGAGIAYLAYGSNLSRRRIEARLGRCEVIGVARLAGFDLRFHKRGRDGSGKCDAFHTGDRSHVVYGVLFGLDTHQADQLDGFEGPGYARREVEVDLHDRSTIAYTYVTRPHAMHPDLAPFDWYKAFVVHGAREHGLPTDYVESLHAIPALVDPDQGRSAENFAILGDIASAFRSDEPPARK